MVFVSKHGLFTKGKFWGKSILFQNERYYDDGFVTIVELFNPHRRLDLGGVLWGYFLRFRLKCYAWDDQLIVIGYTTD